MFTAQGPKCCVSRLWKVLHAIEVACSSVVQFAQVKLVCHSYLTASYVATCYCLDKAAKFAFHSLSVHNVQLYVDKNILATKMK